MNLEKIARCGLQAGLSLALLGVLGGTAVAFVNESTRLNRRRAVELRMPERIASHEHFAHALVQLADLPRANIELLQRLARRCDALLQFHEKVSSAVPSTVHLGLKESAKSLAADIRRLLREFYLKSSVSTRNEHGMVVPVASDVREAELMLLRLLELYTTEIDLLVHQKYDAAIAAQ